MLRYIPNILTIFRFLLVPFTVKSLIANQYIISIIIITISGFTDILDGAIARKYKLITNFGKLMDPLADKFSQLSVLGALVYKSIIPMWILIITLIKEILLVIGASFLYKKDLIVSSKWYGKSATVLFYIAIIVTVILRIFNINTWYNLILYYIALVMTLFSLIMYIKAFYLHEYLSKKNK